MADRVGVINNGRIVLVEDKAALMRKLGKRRLTLALHDPLPALPAGLAGWPLELEDGGRRLVLPLRRLGRGHRRADAAAASRRARRRLQGPRDDSQHPRGHFRRSGRAGGMRIRRDQSRRRLGDLPLRASARRMRTIWQSVATPVITTALYFVVFGGAIGSRMREIGGVSYGAFIVPGLIMLSLLTQSISNASIGIYFPKFTGTIFELLSAPMSAIEAVCAYVGAAATKSVGIGLIILADRDAVCARQDRPPVLDGRLPDPDLGRLQPVRLHHRHLGEEFRAARDHPGAHRHAADLPRRRLLFDRHAAAVLARGRACSIRWSISSAASAGASTARATSASRRASASRCCSSPAASRF